MFPKLQKKMPMIIAHVPYSLLRFSQIVYYLAELFRQKAFPHWLIDLFIKKYPISYNPLFTFPPHLMYYTSEVCGAEKTVKSDHQKWI